MGQLRCTVLFFPSKGSRGLETYPAREFALVDVMWGLSTPVLYCVNQKGTRTGEFMEFDTNGRIVRVVANYTGLDEASPGGKRV
jgi:hypothetical protein